MDYTTEARYVHIYTDSKVQNSENGCIVRQIGMLKTPFLLRAISLELCTGKRLCNLWLLLSLISSKTCSISALCR